MFASHRIRRLQTGGEDCTNVVHTLMHSRLHLCLTRGIEFELYSVHLMLIIKGDGVREEGEGWKKREKESERELERQREREREKEN